MLKTPRMLNLKKAKDKRSNQKLTKTSHKTLKLLQNKFKSTKSLRPTKMNWWATQLRSRSVSLKKSNKTKLNSPLITFKKKNLKINRKKKNIWRDKKRLTKRRRTLKKPKKTKKSRNWSQICLCLRPRNWRKHSQWALCRRSQTILRRRSAFDI